MDCRSPGSSVQGNFQVRILEWVAISSSRKFSQPRDWTHISCVSCIAGGFFTTEPLRDDLVGTKLVNEEGQTRIGSITNWTLSSLLAWFQAHFAKLKISHNQQRAQIRRGGGRGPGTLVAAPKPLQVFSNLDLQGGQCGLQARGGGSSTQTLKLPSNPWYAHYCLYYLFEPQFPISKVGLIIIVLAFSQSCPE